MNTHAKRACSALATVAVVAVIVLGVVGLTAVPVSAQYVRSQLSGPQAGNVDETLRYSIYVAECETPSTCTPFNDFRVTFEFSDDEERAIGSYRAVTDTAGRAGIGFTFEEPGSYQVIVVSDMMLMIPYHSEGNPMQVTISEAPQANLDLSGPASGEVGKTVTYTASVTQSGRALSGHSVTFTFYAVENLAKLNQQTVPTDANGRASASYVFTEPGAYRVNAGGSVSTNDETAVTIYPASVGPLGDGDDGVVDGGGGSNGGGSDQTGGDTTSTNTTNATTAGIDDIASQVETATGLGSNALLIVLGLAGIILLALIAGVFMMRRGRGEDEYEYEGEEPYRRE